MLDGLICQPCAKEESEKEGRWAIRAAKATSSSTKLQDESEVVEKKLPTSNPEHPVRRVTFKDDTPIDSDRESIGLDESSETPSSEEHQISHRKKERDDTTGETNFSSRQSFEVDDLLENNGAKLEAIPADMLRTEDTEEILPDLQHLKRPVRDRVLKILKEFKDLFKTVVSSKGASVTPFELKVDKSGWHQAKNHGRP